MKAYTDIEQSRKLTEILPIESADMHYSKDYDGSWFVDLAEYMSVKIPKYVGNIEEHLLPCWSLAALLSVLPIVDLCAPTLKMKLNHKYYMELCIDYANHKYISTNDYDNPIDATYEMIIKLHEQNLL